MDLNNFLNKDNKEFVDEIHNNIQNNIGDNKFLDKVYEIMIPEKKLQLLLQFDILNYEPKVEEKTNDIDVLINKSIEILKKYQSKIGGYDIEDMDWIVADETSKRFKVKSDRKIIYNTVRYKYNKNDMLVFLDLILKHIKKYILNFDELNVSNKFFYDSYKCIHFVVFIFHQKHKTT